MAQCPDDKGLVMGNAGILRIAPGCLTVTSEDGSKTAKCVVTVTAA